MLRAGTAHLSPIALVVAASACAAGDGSHLEVTLPAPGRPLTASPHASPLPDGIALPAAEACVLRSEGFTGVETLYLARDGGPFASTSRGDAAVLHIPLGAVPRASVLQIDTGGVFIQGYVDPPLYLREPAFVADAILPQSTARLVLREAARTLDQVHLELALPADPAIEILGDEPTLRGDCESVTPTPIAFDVRRVIGLPAEPSYASLAHGEPISLWADPRETPRMRLRPPRDVGVEVLERRAGLTKIAWTHHDVVVVGWVATSDLGPPLYTATSADTTPPVPKAFGPGGIQEVLVCGHDVPLVAVASGRKRTVGAIRAGIALGVGSRHRMLSPVSAWNAPIDPDPRARWFVPTADLAACRRVQ